VTTTNETNEYLANEYLIARRRRLKKREGIY